MKNENCSSHCDLALTTGLTCSVSTRSARPSPLRSFVRASARPCVRPSVAARCVQPKRKLNSKSLTTIVEIQYSYVSKETNLVLAHQFIASVFDCSLLHSAAVYVRTPRCLCLFVAVCDCLQMSLVVDCLWLSVAAYSCMLLSVSV